MQLQQQQRQLRLQEACTAYNDSRPTLGRSIVVSHDLRLLFCAVGKAASTSWFRVLLQLTGKPAAQLLAATDRHSVHTMIQFFLTRARFKNASEFSRSPTKDYYKFMFVREPLERLISAYRDKMFRAAEYVGLRQHIISRFRPHPSARYTHYRYTAEMFLRTVLVELNHSLHVYSAELL